SDFRAPSLDYADFLYLTGALTRDLRVDEKMYRLAAFNVLAHNRDDHAKDFSFLMVENGDWKLAPADDLTFFSGPHGEQHTMVLGEGRSPTIPHLVKLGLEAKLARKLIAGVIEQTRTSLDRWYALSKEFGVSKTNINFISESINS